MMMVMMISRSIKRHALGSACVALLLLAGIHAAYADTTRIIQQVKPSIVAVGTYLPLRQPPARILATGFAVGDGRQILTNAHAIDQSAPMKEGEVLAIFAGPAEKPVMRAARLVAKSEPHDLAVLRVEGTGLPALRLGDSSKVKEGQSLLFTGFPMGMLLGLYPVTHRAMISAMPPLAVPANSGGDLSPAQIRNLRQSYRVFQLDATAYPGNSGSPLYDGDTAVVVGIINKVFVQEGKEHILDRPSGITYAIPIEHAKALLSRARP